MLKESVHALDSVACNLCGAVPKKIIDAQLHSGMWAHVCERCYKDSASKTMQATVHTNRLAPPPETDDGDFLRFRTKVEEAFAAKYNGMTPYDLMGDWPSAALFECGMDEEEALNYLIEGVRDQFLIEPFN